MDIHSCRDSKHANEVQTMIENNEIIKPICGQFGDFITPRSDGIVEGFGPNYIIIKNAVLGMVRFYIIEYSFNISDLYLLMILR